MINHLPATKYYRSLWKNHSSVSISHGLWQKMIQAHNSILVNSLKYRIHQRIDELLLLKKKKINLSFFYPSIFYTNNFYIFVACCRCDSQLEQRVNALRSNRFEKINK